MRAGLLLAEERRHLWHELVHADRRDRQWHTDESVERSVEREAVRRAMPLPTLEWATGQATDWPELVDLLKYPEEWVRFRMAALHPAERAILRRQADD